MKKTATLLASLLVVSALLAGCGDNNAANEPAANAPAAQNQPANDPAPANEPAAEQGYADGVYYAEGQYSEKSGWKDIIALKVEGGKIVSANWNALHKDGGLDKKQSSLEGKYGMKAGGAQAEWHEQAAKAEAFLLEKQDPKAIPFNEEGKTDAISGVSVSVNGFSELATKALEAGPVEAGPYKDGTYRAEEAEFAKSGWKYMATITVMNGKIVAADWNGVFKDGGDDKDTQSKNGTYGMKAKGNAQAEWHEQALKAEQFLIEKQDPKAITYTDDEGHTDAITGVSIHVVEFFTLAEQALQGAK